MAKFSFVPSTDNRRLWRLLLLLGGVLLGIGLDAYLTTAEQLRATEEKHAGLRARMPVVEARTVEMEVDQNLEGAIRRGLSEDWNARFRCLEAMAGEELWIKSAKMNGGDTGTEVLLVSSTLDKGMNALDRCAETSEGTDRPVVSTISVRDQKFEISAVVSRQGVARRVGIQD